MKLKALVLIAIIATTAVARQQSGPAKTESTPAPVKSVEVTAGVTEAEVGQRLQLNAVARDESGKPLDVKPAVWFASPFDVAGVDNSGYISFFSPGEAQVGAVVSGKVGFLRIRVKPSAVTRIDLAPKAQIVAGDAVRPIATARTSTGNPRTDVSMSWK